MAKRKATTSPMELMNGDGSERRGESAASSSPSSSSVPPWSTPKRSLNSGLSVAPSSLSFEAPGGGGGADPVLSRKMKGVNEAFVAAVCVAVRKSPDALLVPLVETYVEHLGSILFPGEGGDFAQTVEKVRRVMKGAAASGSGKSSNSNNNKVSETKVETPKRDEVSSMNAVSSTTSFPAFESKLGSSSSFKSDAPVPVSEVAPKVEQKPFLGKVQEDKKPPVSSGNNVFANLKMNGSFNGPPTFSFNLPNSNSKPAAPTAAVNSTGFTGFKFSPTPTSTTTTNAPAQGGGDNDKEEENAEEPPINEYKQVTEENALYEVRCKVFGKTDAGFKDKGVGQLYLKRLETGGHQVVVRAENNLGTIILNIRLQKGIPLSSKGKDVITCDPTGDNGKPLMILVRVKNQEAATELLEKLKGCQESS